MQQTEHTFIFITRIHFQTFKPIQATILNYTNSNLLYVYDRDNHNSKFTLTTLKVAQTVLNGITWWLLENGYGRKRSRPIWILSKDMSGTEENHDSKIGALAEIRNGLRRVNHGANLLGMTTTKRDSTNVGVKMKIKTRRDNTDASHVGSTPERLETWEHAFSHPFRLFGDNIPKRHARSPSSCPYVTK